MENIYYKAPIVTTTTIIFSPTLLSRPFKNEETEALESLNGLSKDTEPAKNSLGFEPDSARLCPLCNDTADTQGSIHGNCRAAW